MSVRLRLGFIPLDDAASVIVAHAKGFFADEGLEVELCREASWATVRDKLAFGALDAAHMLAPLALAMTLGVAGVEVTPVVGAMALNLNGPAITLSSRLAAAIGPGAGAEGLARLVVRRAEEGASPITLAVVFPFSVHNYLLRDWLARAGIDPDRDVRLTVAPPPRMTELLVEGVVEGFCVTEPWDTAAVAAGAGLIAARSSQLWPRTPDKVLSVTERWAAEHVSELQAMIRAVLRAAAWAEATGNREELVQLLAQAQYVGASREIVAPSLTDIIFHADGANAPAPVHAGWLLSEMVRWGHAPPELDIPAMANRVYRMDLYAEAVRALGMDVPVAPEVLSGFDTHGFFRLSDAKDRAARAAMSRIAAA